MKKLLTLLLISTLLSGCFLRPHKMDVVQGNVISQSDANHLRVGMSQAQVEDIMGTPVMQNVLDRNRVEYIYTFKAGYGQMQVTRVTCIFQNGRLKSIQR